jgi:serine/threonine protein kinase
MIGGHYVLGRLIGQGGMSTVYEALDSVSGRSVAIKMLRNALITDDKGVARIQREAEITKRLRHPQIVRVFDLIEADETIALVLELIEGPTLADLIDQQGPMPPSKAAEIGHLLAGVLQYLADQKVSRIDLKPSNIIMHPDRGPIIIDLGIARSDDFGELTNTGVVIGSPGFMAPEQVQGFAIDPRADLFVLGIILYFCLVGESPYGSGETVAIIYRVVHRRIDVSDLPISAEFRQVIARATELEIDKRFQNADAFQKGLEGTPEWRSYQEKIHRPPATVIRAPYRNADTIQ